MNDNPLHLEWREDGLWLTLTTGESLTGLRLSTSEALRLYEHVQDVLGGWYAEAAAAREAVAAGRTLAEFTGASGGHSEVASATGYAGDGYDSSDPKHPTFYDRAVSTWDNREGK